MSLVFLLIVIVTALVLQSRSQSDNVLQYIRYDCVPGLTCCEAEQSFELVSTISNLSRRPAPSMRLDESFPIRLNIAEKDELELDLTEHALHRKSTLVIYGRQRVIRTLHVSIAQRGLYHFGDARIYADDFLGLKSESCYPAKDEFVVVYPKRIETVWQELTTSDSYDEIARLRYLLRDPMSVVNYREYSGREPMRDISWKQSAAKGRLIVKEYDPTCKKAVAVVLDTAYKGDFDRHLTYLEYCFSLCRTLCEYFEREHIAYRLVTNAHVANNISKYHSDGGFGDAYDDILFALGSASSGAISTTKELLRDSRISALQERGVIYIATRLDDETCKELSSLALSGVSVIRLIAEDMTANGFREGVA